MKDVEIRSFTPSFKISSYLYWGSNPGEEIKSLSCYHYIIKAYFHQDSNLDEKIKSLLC
jgi:hypothetical protein